MNHSHYIDTCKRCATLFVCDGCNRRVRTFRAYGEGNTIPPRYWRTVGDKHYCDGPLCAVHREPDAAQKDGGT